MRSRAAVLILVLSTAATLSLLGDRQTPGYALQRTSSAPFRAGSSQPIEHLRRRLDRSSSWSTATSQNWAGYSAAGAGLTFSSVTASWVEPSIQASYSADVSFWVGLDGGAINSNTVEQIGTAADSQNGAVFYSAWFEMYPDAAVLISMTVSPGDEMTGTVTSDGAGSFTLTLLDGTTHASFTTPQINGVTTPLSAEVIAEAPASGRDVLFPLANFGSVMFSGCAIDGRPLSSFAANQIDQINMVSASGVAEATTSTLGADGASFSVTNSSDSDTTAPITVASGYDSAWHRSAVRVTLTATDNSGGSGVKSITYSIDGGAPTTVALATTRVTIAAAADHSNDGIHRLTFYSTDNNGNQETAKSVIIKIDTTGPTTVTKSASGRKGRPITLKFWVRDNLSPRATSVVLIIRNNHKKVVKTLKLGNEKILVGHAVKWTPRGKGVYRYTVHATDLAGNTQTRASSAMITVR